MIDQFHNLVKYILALKDKPKGKAWLFFGIYLIFFIFYLVFMSICKNTYIYQGDYERGNTGKVAANINILLDGNFKYKYVINLDDKNYVYAGSKNLNNEEFTYNDLEYFTDNEIYLVNKNDWVKAENPYVYSEFYNLDNLKKILENSYYVSKTEYEYGYTSYNLLVSSNTLNKILYGLDTDFDEVPNSVTITCDNYDFINSIKFELNSLCKNNKFCNNRFDIELNYGEYSKVGKINNPLDK